MSDDLAFAKGIKKRYTDQVDEIDNKLRARITAIEEEEQKTKPKMFKLQTLMRANKNAEASKLRREQLLAKPEVPKNAVKHDRPFTSFFGRSSTFGTFDYNGGQVNNYSNNKDLESSYVISKSRDAKSLKMIRPSWTV